MTRLNPSPPATAASPSNDLKVEVAGAQPVDSQLELIAWCQKYLPDHFSLDPSDMHRWLAAELDRMRHVRGARINVIGPRGSAKSTLATLGHVLRVATAGWEPYIWIVCDTADQARNHLDNISTELTENQSLCNAYGVALRAGRRWRRTALELQNEVAIECFGTGQRVRGRRRGANRPTLIICDDLQNDQHIDSARQRERSRRWFHGALLPAGTAKTNVVNVATALHVDALALTLSRAPAWTSRSFAAIEQWPIHSELWSQWESIYCDLENPERAAHARAFYEEHRQQMDDGAKVLWPAVGDLYWLMQQRIEAGHAAFEREQQGSPFDPERCEWPEDYFTKDLWFDEWPEGLAIKTMALDPSKGQDAGRGDYSAFVLLGIAQPGTIYVEADLARRPVPDIVGRGVDLLRRFRPDQFVIESNQFQELLQPLFLAELARVGMWGVAPSALHNHANKIVRIRKLGTQLSLRLLRFKSQSASTRLLVEQLQQFPQADHDDGPDALEMAIRCATAMQRAPPDDGLGDRLVWAD